MKRCALAVIALALGGCYSFSTMGRARTLAAHHVEAWLAPEALVVATGSGASIRPVGEGGERYGITDGVEFDARISTLGATLGPRLQLRRSPTTTHGIDIAFAPAVAYTYPDKMALESPVLFGLNLPGEHQIIIAPRLTYQVRVGVPGSPGVVNYVYVGTSLGIALRITGHLTLMPEVAVLGQVYVDNGYSSNVGSGLGLQGGIGVLIDP